jgi:hypothetical protein
VTLTALQLLERWRPSVLGPEGVSESTASLGRCRTSFTPLRLACCAVRMSWEARPELAVAAEN